MARLPLTELREKISQAIEERRYDDAAAAARVILEAYPKSVLAQRLLGEALWENGQPEEASEAFQRVLQYDPEDFVAYAGLGLIAEQQGSLDKAITQVQRASELAPNSEEVRSELARLYERRGSADSARLKISRAALARIYARSEMPSRAVSEFRAVLDDQPDRADVRLGLAEALWRDGQKDEARHQAETILKYLPDCLKAQLILGAVAKAEGREQNAQELFDEAMAIDPLAEYAERLFGTDSPLLPTDPLIEVPGYLLGSKEEAGAASEIEIELPDWLKEEPTQVLPPAASEPESLSVEPSGSVAPAVSTESSVASSTPQEKAGWLDDLRRSLPLEAEDVSGTPALAVSQFPPKEVSAATLAWQSYQKGDLPGAVAAYERLVEAEQDLGDVIRALTVIVADTADIDAMELLGDAHVRAGHYRAALDSYQRVLERLQRRH